MRQILTLQNDTLELIAWREFGQVFGVVEELSELNPKLLDLELFEPGIIVILPDSKTQQTSKVQRLGD